VSVEEENHRSRVECATTRREFLCSGVGLGIAPTLAHAVTTDAPFASQIFQPGSNCTYWPLSVAAFRLNSAFIAPPRQDEDRESWLRAVKDYRQALRTGADNFGVRMHPGSFDRRHSGYLDSSMSMFRAVAAAYDFLPGERVRVVVDARGVEGEGVIGILFQVHNRHSGKPVEAPHHVGELAMKIPRGQWQTLEFSIVVPEFNRQSQLVSPIVTFKGALQTQRPQIDIRSILFVVDEESRMQKAFDARVSTPECNRGIDLSSYDRDDLKWSSHCFTLYLTFVWDRNFYDPEKNEYQLDSLLADGEREFGGYDGLLIWVHNPRFGIDERNHFDCLRDLPGGLPALKKLSEQLHRRGIKLYIPQANAYNGTTGPRYEGRPDADVMAEIITVLDADGVNGDTMSDGWDDLTRKLAALRPQKGIVFEPEVFPSLSRLGSCNISWAVRLIDPEPPGILLLKWTEPRHIMRHFRLYRHMTDGSRSHREDIATAFFNGSGMLIWEQYGTYTPWSNDDRRLWRRVSGILHHCAEFFTNDEWDPFYPTLTEGLYANHWRYDRSDLFTLINRGKPGAAVPLLDIDGEHDTVCFDLWTGTELRTESQSSGKVRIMGTIEHFGAILVTRQERVDRRLEQFLDRQRHETSSDTGNPQRNHEDSVVYTLFVPKRNPLGIDSALPPGMVRVSGTTFYMRLTHEVPEYNCYPDPGTPPERLKYFLEAYDYGGTMHHNIGPITLPDFFIDEAQVTNAEYERFLRATAYRPTHVQNFLKHWPNGQMPWELAEHPVVYVDLDDARAYARWAGKRLPTEEEWHLAAQGRDGRTWPWGTDFEASKCNPGGHTMPARSFPAGRSPYGCYNMSGNVWELTESVRSDGHTRFCMIRGGSFQHNSGSSWFLASGPQPCSHHAKFMLIWPGLDRCSTVGFRCVKG
jgi:formylglycine-generating enzyme required for sulfatase activity